MRIRPWAVAGVVLVVLLSVIAWLSWSLRQRADLGNKPTRLVFNQVFGTPPPAGVYNLKVAGMSSLSGVVWMRFQVRDVHAFLADLRRDARVPVNGPPSISGIPAQSEADRDPYSRAVGWDGVYSVRAPQHYDYGPLPEGRGWIGEMVVDRGQRVVYVHGGLL